ncbi:ATP-dependent RNA helicase dhx8 [Morus notabilis]|uniref:RNA helicase n=1 Tax=Morus notabilis TaxID=981085 RepID=W9RHP0_9ROSA|nr:ATP-dependent RNA helicase dhx8 [Morus notabilis]
MTNTLEALSILMVNDRKLGRDNRKLGRNHNQNLLLLTSLSFSLYALPSCLRLISLFSLPPAPSSTVASALLIANLSGYQCREIAVVVPSSSDFLLSPSEIPLARRRFDAESLTGDDIDAVVQMLNEEVQSRGRNSSGLLTLPLYSGLPRAEQELVFTSTPTGKRKVVISTNVAETSLTLEGIVYVVDSGFSKQRFYDPISDIENLVVAPISKASARQRAASPSPKNMVRALEILYSLGVLDDNAKLTSPAGFQVAQIPLDPMISKIILSSSQHGCSEEIITITAILSIQYGAVPGLPRGRTGATPGLYRGFPGTVPGLPGAVRGPPRALVCDVESLLGIDFIGLTRTEQGIEGDHVTFLNVYKGFFQSDEIERLRRGNNGDLTCLLVFGENRKQLSDKKEILVMVTPELSVVSPELAVVDHKNGKSFKRVCHFLRAMATEDDSIDQAVAARRERLKALKAAQELLNTPDEDSVQVEDKKNNDNDSREETNPNMKFRNYVPHDEHLQEGKVAPPVVPKFEDPVAAMPPPSEKEEDPFVNIAPKKPNWDLRRDVQKKFDKLERRTHKAIYKLMDELGRFARRPENPSEVSSHTSSPPSTPASLAVANPFAMAQNEEVQQKTLNDYLHPTRTATPSCIMFPPNMPNLDFNPGMIQLLPTFHGLESENPYVHIREFEEVVATFHNRAEAADSVRLKFFPFSLKDKAKSWLYSLRPRSIGTWEEITTAFFNKYFPHHKTNGLKRQISTFTQKDNETLYQVWERFKDLLNQCPHHSYESWRLDPEEAFEYLNELAEKAHTWTGPSVTDNTNRSRPAGIYQLREEDNLKAQIESLTRQIETLKTKEGRGIHMVARAELQEPCFVCGGVEHLAKDCPAYNEMRGVYDKQCNALGSYYKPFSNRYNPGWRNHPNFSWRDSNQAQPSGGQWRTEQQPQPPKAYSAPQYNSQ